MLIFDQVNKQKNKQNCNQYTVKIFLSKIQQIILMTQGNVLNFKFKLVSLPVFMYLQGSWIFITKRRNHCLTLHTTQRLSLDSKRRRKLINMRLNFKLEQSNPKIVKSFSSCILKLDLISWPGLGGTFISQNHRELYASYFLKEILFTRKQFVRMFKF